jgi:hypothetical protein
MKPYNLNYELHYASLDTVPNLDQYIDICAFDYLQYRLEMTLKVLMTDQLDEKITEDMLKGKK